MREGFLLTTKLAQSRGAVRFNASASISRKSPLEMNSEKAQIRAVMLYEFRQGTSAAETSRKLCDVVGRDAVTERTCARWFEKFRSGSFGLEDAPRSGRPRRVFKDALHRTVNENPTATAREMAAHFDVSHTTIINALHALGMTSKLSKLVPHKLTEKNKMDRIAKCVSLLARHQNRPFLDRLVTCDEKWIFYENFPRKRQWSRPGQGRAAVPRRDMHGKKAMLCVWWDIRGIVYSEFLPRGQTITSDLYCRQLDRVHAQLVRTRPQLVNRKGVLFHQDNARPHVSAQTMRKISELKWELIAHPPYSPDLAPSDFHLFRSLQNFLQSKNYRTEEQVKNGVEGFMRSQPRKFFENGIKKLVGRWEQVISNRGEYIFD